MFTQPTQIPRSPFASVLTVVFHTGLVVCVLLATAVPNIPRIAPNESLFFVSATLPPDLEFDPPKPPPPEEPARLDVPEPPKAAEAPPVIAKAPEPAPTPPAVEPKPFQRAPEAPAVPRLPAIAPAGFSDAAAAARRPAGVPDVAAAGFESAGSQKSQDRKTVAVGGFETASAGAKGNRATAVADSGFGGTARGDERRVARATGAAGFASDDAPKPAVQQPRTTSTPGFADQAAPRQAAAPPAPVSAPQAAGFADTPTPTRAATPTSKAPKADQPAEVTYKPTPAYTDEARAMRIEGEVALEVEFTADGRVRVLRVVRGLGYGLDEMARRAAEQIRFKPATSQGVPVATRTTLTILFRLT